MVANGNLQMINGSSPHLRTLSLTFEYSFDYIGPKIHLKHVRKFELESNRDTVFPFSFDELEEFSLACRSLCDTVFYAFLGVNPMLQKITLDAGLIWTLNMRRISGELPMLKEADINIEWSIPNFKYVKNFVNQLENLEKCTLHCYRNSDSVLTISPINGWQFARFDGMDGFRKIKCIEISRALL